MLGTVPPVPVAAFGDPKLLLRPPQAFRIKIRTRGISCVKVARIGQQVPCPVIFLRADPDVEVGIDPGARHNVGERSRLYEVQGLAGSYTADFRVALEQIIELSEKRPAVLAIELPRVFTIENQRNHRLAVTQAASSRPNSIQQRDGRR